MPQGKKREKTNLSTSDCYVLKRSFHHMTRNSAKNLLKKNKQILKTPQNERSIDT
jgi:hypothetical protein